MTTLNSTTPTVVDSAKVEDVDSSSEDGMPDLQPAQPGQAASGASAQAKPTAGKGQSRAEKKSRKAVQRLGMKPFPGIVSVKVKKGKGQVLFVVNNPEVFKNPGSDNTYVIFGEAKVEQDNVNQALAENLAQFKNADLGGGDDEIPALVPTGEAGQVEEVKTEGAAESTIENIDNLAQLVIDQTSCSKAAAIKALNETNGDVVSAIMKVTSI